MHNNQSLKISKSIKSSIKTIGLKTQTNHKIKTPFKKSSTKKQMNKHQHQEQQHESIKVLAYGNKKKTTELQHQTVRVLVGSLIRLAIIARQKKKKEPNLIPLQKLGI